MKISKPEVSFMKIFICIIKRIVDVFSLFLDKVFYLIFGCKKSGEMFSLEKPLIKTDITKYFSGGFVSFKKYAIVFDGTDFQKKVWRALSHIPYGKVLTYKQVAEKIGAPNASRAVGGACGANELPIIIPCHRVVGSSGGLGGFSGGLKLKEFLLRLEGVELSS